MSLLSDLDGLDGLDRLARRLESSADELRRRAGRLAAADLSRVWSGLAASDFQRCRTDLSGGLRRSAQRLDDAAQLLRAHAAEVRSRLAELAVVIATAREIEVQTAAAARSGLRAAGDVFESGAKVFGEAFSVIGG